METSGGVPVDTISKELGDDFGRALDRDATGIRHFLVRIYVDCLRKTLILIIFGEEL